MNRLKLPKIPVQTSTNCKHLFLDDEDKSEPTVSAPPEISYILIILRDLILSVGKVDFLFRLIKDFNKISVLHGAGLLAEKLGDVYPYFQVFNEAYCKNLPLENAQNGVEIRKILRFFHKAYPNNEDLELAFCMVQCHDGDRGHERNMDMLTDYLIRYVDLVEINLRSSKKEDRDHALKLERSKMISSKRKARVKISQEEIENGQKCKEEQICRKCEQIAQLNCDLENIATLKGEFVAKISQDQINAIQRIQSYSLQQEWIMHRKIREISVELKALRRANTDTEFLLRQRSNDSEDLVTELHRHYDHSMGLSKASLQNEDFVFQEEFLTLQELQKKAELVENEFNNILKEREEEEKRRKMRVDKIKHRFRLVARTLAYFRKEKPQEDSNGQVLTSPKTPKKHKKLSFKKST